MRSALSLRRVCVALFVLVLALSGCARVGEALFSEKPMERYLAEKIALERRFTAQTLPPAAAASSLAWVAVVEVLGTQPQAPNGCDVYLRYFAGVPAVGGSVGTPAVGEAGFAVAHVEDPDEPSGPVTFRFPGEGAQWSRSMSALMPEKYWRGVRPKDLSALKGAWSAKVRELTR